MIHHTYGEFSPEQISGTKARLKKRIFYLLFIVDPKTAVNFQSVDIRKAFDSLLVEFGGLNNLLGYPVELVSILSLINAAKLEYENPDFDWMRFRKTVLDAGALVDSIKGVTTCLP